VYLLFLTVLAAFGVLAYYAGHITTLQIVFLISIPLLLVAPVSAIWYSWAIFRKNVTEKAAPSERSLLIRIVRSPVGRVLTRIVNNPIVKLLEYSLSIFMVGFTIIRIFPLHPRAALAIIVAYITVTFASVIIDVDNSITRSRRESLETINSILGILKDMTSTLSRTGDLAEMVSKFVTSHMETHENITIALKAIQHTTEVLANPIQTRQLDAPPEENEEHSDD
jgi:hypothetical protein